MAKVPFAQKLRSVTPRPLNQPFSTLSAQGRGEGVAEGLKDLGEDLTQAAAVGSDFLLKRKIEDNKRIAKQMHIDFLERRRELLHGESGFYTLNGEAAVTAAPRIKEDLQKLKDEISSRTEVDSIKAMFSDQVDIDLQTSLTSIDKETIKQREVSEVATSTARIKAVTDDVSLNPTRENLNSAEKVIRSESVDMSRRQGESGFTTQQIMETSITELYRNTIVTQLKAGNDQTARRLLNENGDKINDTIEGVLKGMVEEGVLLGQTQREGDKIMSMGLTPTEAQTFIINNFSDNPELRKSLSDDLARRFTAKKKARDAEIEGFVSEAVTDIANNTETRNSWCRKNPERCQVVKGDQDAWKNLKEATEAASEDRLYAEASDGKIFADFENSSPQGIVSFNLEANRHRFTEDEYQKAISTQKGARATLDQKSTSYEPMNQARKVLKEFAPKHLKWNKEKQSNSNKAIQNKITNRVASEITEITDQGIKPDTETIRAIVQKEFIELEQPIPIVTSLFGITDEEAAFMIQEMSESDKQDFNVPVENLTPQLRAEVTQRFRREGQGTPDDATIAEFLKAEMFKDSATQRRLLGLSNKQPTPLNKDGTESEVPAPKSPVKPKASITNKPGSFDELVTEALSVGPKETSPTPKPAPNKLQVTEGLKDTDKVKSPQEPTKEERANSNRKEAIKELNNLDRIRSEKGTNSEEYNEALDDVLQKFGSFDAFFEATRQQ